MMLCSWASIWLDKTLSFAKSDPLLEQYVQDKQERLAEEKRTKGRMYKSLGILGGILIMSGIAIRRRKPALEIEIVFKIAAVGIIWPF